MEVSFSFLCLLSTVSTMITSELLLSPSVPSLRESRPNRAMFLILSSISTLGSMPRAVGSLVMLVVVRSPMRWVATYIEPPPTRMSSPLSTPAKILAASLARLPRRFFLYSLVEE